MRTLGSQASILNDLKVASSDEKVYEKSIRDNVNCFFKNEAKNRLFVGISRKWLGVQQSISELVKLKGNLNIILSRKIINVAAWIYVEESSLFVDFYQTTKNSNVAPTTLTSHKTFHIHF